MPSTVFYSQLEIFHTVEPCMFIDRTVYICDDYIFPSNLIFPFKLLFTASIMCLEGDLQIGINQNELIMKRGDMCIIHSGSIIESLSHSEKMNIQVMAFPETDEDWLSSRNAENVESSLLHSSVPLFFHNDEKHLMRYLSLYSDVKEIFANTAEEWRDEIVKAFLSISSASMMSQYHAMLSDRIHSKQSSRNEEVFLCFMDDLQKFASSERTVQFYADRLCISAKHFSRLVFQASGQLPMKHIKRRVIIEAKTLLGTTEMTVSEIADALNFPNDSFFCRYFKLNTGLTPSEFRIPYRTPAMKS